MDIIDVLSYILAGAGVGMAVGMTGIGGGSLMTPILLFFNFPPHIAVGTDLLYASFTKMSSTYSHFRHGHVQWSVTRQLALGSLPASGITLLLLNLGFGSHLDYQYLLTTTLGIMLVLTSVTVLYRKQLIRWIQSFDTETPQDNLACDGTSAISASGPGFKLSKSTLTIVSGAALGILVTLSSVGAGALGTALLLLIYPALSATRVVGTELAHAVPLTLIAGIGYSIAGSVDYGLLACLLVGSIPATHLGARLAHKAPSELLQKILATILLVIGAKYILF